MMTSLPGIASCQSYLKIININIRNGLIIEVSNWSSSQQAAGNRFYKLDEVNALA